MTNFKNQISIYLFILSAAFMTTCSSNDDGLLDEVQGTGTANAYNNGVTNNGISSGEITFTIPADAPNTLIYNCEFHGAMTGTITIID